MGQQKKKGRGKQKDTQVRPTSSTSKELETQSHSNVTETPNNKSESGVKKEPTMADQTVSDTEAMVVKEEDTESTFLNKMAESESETIATEGQILNNTESASSQEELPNGATPVDIEEHETDTNPTTANKKKSDSNSGTAVQEEPPHGATPAGTEEHETDTNPATANQTKSDSNSRTAVQEKPPHGATPAGTEEHETDTNPATANQNKSDSNSIMAVQEEPPHGASPAGTEEHETDTNPTTANQIKCDSNSRAAVQEEPPHGATLAGTEEHETDTNPAIAKQIKSDSNSRTAVHEEPPHGATPAGTEEHETDTNPTTANQKKSDSNSGTAVQEEPPHGATPAGTEEHETDTNSATANRIKCDSNSRTAVQEEPPHGATPAGTEEHETDTNPATANLNKSDSNTRTAVHEELPHGATPAGTEEHDTDTNPATANQIKCDSNSRTAVQEEPPHGATPAGTEEHETDTNPATANQIKYDSNSRTTVQEEPPHGATPAGTEEHETATNPATANQTKSDSYSGTAVQEETPHGVTPVGTEKYETDTNPATANLNKSDSSSRTAKATEGQILNNTESASSQEELPHGATPVDTEEHKTNTNPATANQNKSDSNSRTAVQEGQPHSVTPVGTEEHKTDTSLTTANQIKCDSNSRTAVQEEPPHGASPAGTEEHETDTNPATANQIKCDSNSRTTVQEEPPHGATPAGTEEHETATNPATANQTKSDSYSGTAVQEETPHGVTPVGTEKYETDTNPAIANLNKSDSSSRTAKATEGQILNNTESASSQEELLHGATPVDTEEHKTNTNPATANQNKSDSNSRTAVQEGQLHSVTPVGTEEHKTDTNLTTANQTNGDSNSVTADQVDVQIQIPVGTEGYKINSISATPNQTKSHLPSASSSSVDTEEYEINTNLATSNQTKGDSNSETTDQKKSLSNDPPSNVVTAESEIDCKSAIADRTEIDLNPATSDQEKPLKNDTPVYNKESEIESNLTTADQEDSLHKATEVDTEELEMGSKSATVNKRDAEESTTSIYTKTATDGQKEAVNTDKEGIDQIKLLKNMQKMLTLIWNLVQYKDINKDNTELDTELINRKEPEDYTRSTIIDIETIKIELQQLVKDIQKSLQHTSTPEAENSKLENLQEVIKIIPSLIFAADTNQLLQKLEIEKGISLLGVIVPLSANLSTTIEHLIGQGKHSDTQVPPTSSTSKGIELQCHSNILEAPSNQNERGVKTEPKPTADQTVDNTALAAVSKNKEEELLENILVHKNETVGLTDGQKGNSESKILNENEDLQRDTTTTDAKTDDNTNSGAVNKKVEIACQRNTITVHRNEELGKKESLENEKDTTVGQTELAKVDEIKVSADRIELSELDVNTEPVQDNKKKSGTFEPETNSHKLHHEFASRVYADISMLSLLWTNLPTDAKKTLIGLLKKNYPQVSPVYSTGDFDTQKVINDIAEAYINEDERELENFDQSVHGTELMINEKFKESGIQTKSIPVDQNEDSESKIFNENEVHQRDTATTDAKTDGNTNSVAVDKKVEIVCQKKTVTFNRNEETLGKKESLENETDVTASHTELAIEGPEPKVIQSVDGTEVTTVDKKEMIETNSLHPFMVNSCRLTAVKGLDLNDLQAWCTTISSNTGICLKDEEEKAQTNVVSNQVNIETENQDNRSISQASSYESLYDSISETLRFHSVHGKNVVLSCSNLTVQRVKNGNFLSKGIAFSCRPVRVSEKICLRMENLSDYKFGVITFGFTSIDPKTLIEKLPDNAITDLANLPGFWAHRLEKSLCKKNNILNYKVNNSGNVQYGINNIKKGVLYWGIDTSKPIWGYIDIIGYSTTLKFTSLKEDRKPSITAPLPLLKYQIQFLPLIPSNLHILQGDNIEFISFKGVVAKTDTNNNKGYIFSKHPIRPGQTIVVQILSAGPKSEFLPLGLTARDPLTLSLSELPDDAENLTDNSEYWTVYKNVSNCVKNGDELAITLTCKGEIQLTRNDDEPVTVKHVKKSEKFWAFLQIYGTIETVRIWSTVRVSPRPRNSEQ